MFADIITFIGDIPPTPVDDNEEMILEARTDQGRSVQILDDMYHRLDTRFRLELGDRLSALLNGVGVHPTLM